MLETLLLSNNLSADSHPLLASKCRVHISDLTPIMLAGLLKSGFCFGKAFQRFCVLEVCSLGLGINIPHLLMEPQIGLELRNKIYLALNGAVRLLQGGSSRPKQLVLDAKPSFSIFELLLLVGGLGLHMDTAGSLRLLQQPFQLGLEVLGFCSRCVLCLPKLRLQAR